MKKNIFLEIENKEWRARLSALTAAEIYCKGTRQSKDRVLCLYIIFRRRAT